jgi:hypothetical protein
MPYRSRSGAVRRTISLAISSRFLPDPKWSRLLRSYSSVFSADGVAP